MFKFTVICFLMAVIVTSSYADDSNPCEQPIDGGFCYGSESSYGYDQASNSCQEFDYGGCGGNSNRFSRKEDCEARCVH